MCGRGGLSGLLMNRLEESSVIWLLFEIMGAVSTFGRYSHYLDSIVGVCYVERTLLYAGLSSVRRPRTCILGRGTDRIYPLGRLPTTTQRRQNVWRVGAARSAWWIFSEQYFWGSIQWRENGIRKGGYLWRRFQVCSLWGKEEVLQNIFIRPEIDWGAIREPFFEWLGSEKSSDRWQFMRNKKYSKKWMRSIYSLKLCPHVMKICTVTYKIYLTGEIRAKTYLKRYPYRLTHFSTLIGSW